MLGFFVAAEEREIVLNYFNTKGEILYQLSSVLFVVLDFLYLNNHLYDYVVYRNEVAIRKKLSVPQLMKLMFIPIVVLFAKVLLLSFIFGLTFSLLGFINCVLFTIFYVVFLPCFEKFNKEELFTIVIVVMMISIRIVEAYVIVVF